MDEVTWFVPFEGDLKHDRIVMRHGDNERVYVPERKTGKWIWNKRTGEYECSECGCNPIYDGITPDCSEIDKYRYCRWCGAPMEGSE